MGVQAENGQKKPSMRCKWQCDQIEHFCMVLATKFLAKVTKKFATFVWAILKTLLSKYLQLQVPTTFGLSLKKLCNFFIPTSGHSVNIDLYLQHRGPGRCRRPWREGQRPNGGLGLTEWGFEEASARRSSCTSASSSGTPYHPRSSSGSGSLKGTWNMSTWRSARSKGRSSTGKYRTKYSEVEPSTGR